MNGRLYDPLIGRMLSPDNYVADATNTQDYNRYSYVANNPLKYTDPSGWNKDIVRLVMSGMGSEDNFDNSGGGGDYNPLDFEGSYYHNSNWQVSTNTTYGASMPNWNSGNSSTMYYINQSQTTTYNVFDASSWSSWQSARGGSFSIGSYNNNIGGHYAGGSGYMNNATAGLGTSFSSANYGTCSHFIPLDAAIQGKLSKKISNTLGFTYSSGLTNVMGHYFGYTSLVLMGYSINTVMDIASKHEQFVGFGAKFFKDKDDLLDDAVDAKNNVLVFNKLIPYIQSLNKTYTSVLGLAQDILSFMKTDGYYRSDGKNVVFEKLSEQQYNMYLGIIKNR